MIFITKSNCNLYVWDGHKLVPFVEGKLETEDKDLIEKMLAYGYETIEKDELEELTVLELKERAKEKGVEGYRKMKRAELLEVLGE